MEPTFEIGLVMAGAVSAGAYTAGVLDFLIQALDTWEAAKAAGSVEAPRHRVRLKVLAGTSAGGMTAAIATRVLAGKHQPVRNAEQAAPGNQLYKSWVTSIDLDKLVGSEDLASAGVRSLLDGTALDRIADEATRFSSREEIRPWVEDPLHVITTFTNLRGIPYTIAFDGVYRAGHEMTSYADHVHFVIGDATPKAPDGGVALTWAHNPDDSPGWRAFRDAALATGAFPIGLPARVLDLDRASYDRRAWSVPLSSRRTGPGRCLTETEQRPIPPHWPENTPPTFQAVCVDGGVTNNHPFDLAHAVMRGDDCANPRASDKAVRALVMIDPFAGWDINQESYLPNVGLGAVAGALLSAMKNQPRFKPDELVLAQDGDVRSRFLIAPARDGARHPIACGALAGFAGFLSEAFRKHDFMLGRRNCQSFLRKYFCLAENHDLFGSWTEPQRKARTFDFGGERSLPIIPLVDDADLDCAAQPWPHFGQDDLDRVGNLIERRYLAVVPHLVQGPIRRFGARLAARLFQDEALGALKSAMVRELESYGLWDGPPAA